MQNEKSNSQMCNANSSNGAKPEGFPRNWDEMPVRPKHYIAPQDPVEVDFKNNIDACLQDLDLL